MADNYIDVTLSEIFGTGVASVEQTETSAEPGGYNVWTITLTNGQTSTFTVRNGTAGGSPMPVLNSVDMVDTTGIYLYLGNEEGYTTGHWYCYANEAWTDYGAYSEKGDPGLAPTVEISKTGGTTTITITDAEGEHVATIEDGISPTVNVANTAAEMTDTSVIYVYTGSETGYTAGNYYFYDTSLTQWVSGGQYQSTVPSIDSTLTVQGAAADSAKVGQEISDLKSQIAQLEAIPRSVKLAMDTLFQNVAMKDDAVYSDEYAVFHAWASAVKLLSISAVFDQGENVVYETDSLDSLKQYLTVTASYDDGSSATVGGYTLSGELATGTSTITVLFDGKSTTFDTTVTAVIYHLENRTFNNDGGINTQLKVLETDRDISMVFDADFAVQDANVTWKPFVVMNSASPWEGVDLQADSNSAKLIWMTKTASVPIARSYVGNVKVVITHAVGSGSMKYYYKVGNANMVSGTLTEAFKAISGGLWIGGGGPSGRWNGTVNKFVVYDSVISTARINEFINR